MSALLFGFSNLKDIANKKVTSDLIPVLNTAVEQSVAVHTEMTNRMLALFTQRTTDYKIRYKSPVAAKLQNLDENGRARKMKMAGYYDIAFPLLSAGTAFGKTRIAAAKQTVQDVNDDLMLILDADKRWLRDQIFAALFDNAGYDFVDDEHGTLAIKGLANGDTTKYLVRAGAEEGTTANHYRAITAMDDANQNFSSIYRDLTVRPENAGGGRVITFIPTNLRDDVEGLASFVEQKDEDISVSANTDVLVNGLPIPVIGDVVGKVNKNWIVEWNALPDDRCISVITSGDRPLALREHPEASLQGFNRVSDKADDPYYESQFVRYAGLGAYNRVGAIITKVGAGGYSVPTGFEQPIQ